MTNEPTWPASDLVAVTPSDTTEYFPPLRLLYVGTGGSTVTVVTQAGTTITFKNPASGHALGPFFISKVLASSTAADIVGFY